MTGKVLRTFRSRIGQALAFARRKVEGRLFALRILRKRGRFPNTIIIGAMKAGTTSLYEYLTEHPEVCGARHKEIQYFDTHFHKGPDWYRASFDPLAHQKAIVEASPHTAFRPECAERVKALIPDAKLIFLVRNPIDRAHSHFNHFRELGYEQIPTFEEAIAAEPARVESLSKRLATGDEAAWLPYRNATYVRHGLYAEQLERWLEYFPAQSILIIKSEEMFADPQGTLDRVTDFLDLSRHALIDPSPRNQRGNPEISTAVRAELNEIFDEPNRRFEQLTGWSWE